MTLPPSLIKRASEFALSQGGTARRLEDYGAAIKLTA